jgi:hypothetical protein
MWYFLPFFKMKQTLIQHHRIHVKKPFLKCEYCPREFRTYKGKKYHILKDHAEKAGDFSFKSFVCETCGKSNHHQVEQNTKNTKKIMTKIDPTSVWSVVADGKQEPNWKRIKKPQCYSISVPMQSLTFQNDLKLKSPAFSAWSFRMWYFLPLYVRNSRGQYSHFKNGFLTCILWCWIRVCFILNDRPHCSHTYSAFPWWDNICRFKKLLWQNLIWHI